MNPHMLAGVHIVSLDFVLSSSTEPSTSGSMHRCSRLCGPSISRKTPRHPGHSPGRAIGGPPSCAPSFRPRRCLRPVYTNTASRGELVGSRAPRFPVNPRVMHYRLPTIRAPGRAAQLGTTLDVDGWNRPAASGRAANPPFSIRCRPVAMNCDSQCIHVKQPPAEAGAQDARPRLFGCCATACRCLVRSACRTARSTTSALY